MNDQTTFDDKENSISTIKEKISDLSNPGYQVEFDPIEAEHVGAFVENAINEQDALDSDIDLLTN